MSCLRRCISLVWLLLLTLHARAQFATMTISTPPYLDVFAYDEARDVLVGYDWMGGTWEYDGNAWASRPSAHYPPYGPVYRAYDAHRRRVVLVDAFGAVWEWDGLDWQYCSTAPFQVFPPQMQHTGWNYDCVYDESRRTVLMMVPNMGSGFLELWEWDGSVWQVATGAPSTATPRWWASPWATYYYHAIAYDRRAAKVVIYGREDTGSTSANPGAGITWTWDASGGWTEYPQGSSSSGNCMWFDDSRGRVVREQDVSGVPNPVTLWELDAGTGTWTPASRQGGLPLVIPIRDSLRNRVYSTWGRWLTIDYLYDAMPAAYDRHAPGCVGASMPTIGLTQPWSRAWLGDSLSVDAAALPGTVALLAMGFSDQAAGAATLPLDLSSYGMPGCILRIAPDAVLLAAGAANQVTFTVPIPSIPALVGTVFFQQVFAPAPAANAAGMLASDSYRGTIGLR